MAFDGGDFREVSPVDEPIVTSGDGLLLVINDILDISKLEAGKLSLENRPFDIIKMLNEVTYLLDSYASDKGIDELSFFLKIPSDS